MKIMIKNVKRKGNVGNMRKIEDEEKYVLVVCTSYQSAVGKSCYRVGDHSVVMSISSLTSSVLRGVVLSASSRLENVVSSGLRIILLLMFSSPVASFTC